MRAWCQGAEGALLNARTLAEGRGSRSQPWVDSHRPAEAEAADGQMAASVLHELDELQKELRSALIGMDPKLEANSRLQN